ncbi:5-(carboxyamino)imidazole ribonucleotide mutase [Ferrimonas sediminicola]|uniref:N5-carboxyaminoimidazole ribonucleotide mutase n=1 Tax=Ferrimonas sediminicola TaxID=2569538 RepID=A0A4U1BD77_9GAMM|nr:5-(carboxyamino)imidazole ribonucleotide mutase [Ferrimonas sediminicola]TKB48516.1 5-(carboxyamino)imidazole ribonucleotide mutase [Ferrimonas sediminicola]
MSQAQVSIIMGSQSDWTAMEDALAPLETLGIAYETRVVSAHRTPDRLYRFCQEAHLRGIRVIIAGAGGSAHLAGMVAAITHLPVVAVPVSSRDLKGMDSLMSMVQMPRGVAVACQGIGNAFNAGLMAAQMLALSDPELTRRLIDWRHSQSQAVVEEVRG